MKCEVKCSTCDKPSTNPLSFKCPSCGEPLIIRQTRKFEIGQIYKKNCTLWRYAEFFPYVEENNIITLGEGWTPLVRFSDNVYFKLESSNPTGSFKDRGSTTLISALHKPIEKVKGYVAEDSSGNAGASIAAYAARARVRAHIYVPETVSGPKFKQIQFYGAQVTKVAGSRARVAEEAQRHEKGKFYVGHILHPLFRDGIRSLAYEICEQQDWKAPERIYLPVSAGTLLLGVLDGLKHLVDSSLLDTMPEIVACQTTQVSPLCHRLKGSAYKPPERVTSVADALVSTNPPLLRLMVDQLRKAGGDAVTVEENKVLDSFKELARHGFFVEPSSAVAYAAYKKHLNSKETSKKDKALIILTGSGLKTNLDIS